MTTRKLLVIPAEPISGWISKGEVIDRYFNPGDLFDEVHVLLMSDEDPDSQQLQRLVGRASVQVHKVLAGSGLFWRSIAWRPKLLRSWAKDAVGIASKISPHLVRCHGAHLNGIAAMEIKRALRIPYVVSLHSVDLRGRKASPKQRLAAHAQKAMESAVLRNADLVLPVYEPIVPYLEHLGVERFEVAYNMINPTHLSRKSSYGLSEPVRLICTGRQFHEKDPSNILRAVARQPRFHLTLVGNGSKHGDLVHLAERLDIQDRTKFLPAVPNDELCRMLPSFDIYVTHSEFLEISKSVLEALLTGLPVVINKRSGPPVPELTDDICVLVSDDSDSYERALVYLAENHQHREQLGRAAYEVAHERWDPLVTETHFAKIYERVALPSTDDHP